MLTQDGRRIISGFYSTEEDRKKCLTPEQWKKWKQLEKNIAERDTRTKEIVRGRNHDHDQHSIIGSPGQINPWDHSEGTIGNTIDYCVELGVFTKEQIEILAGTKMNKINSHLRSMARKGEYEAVEDDNGIVAFKEK